MHPWPRLLCTVLLLLATSLREGAAQAPAPELSEQRVLDTMQAARKSLLSHQHPDGSWPFSGGIGGDEMIAGSTSLATLALLNTGLTNDDPAVKRALKYLRETAEPKATYSVSLMLMVFSLAKEPRDRLKMERLVGLLEQGQIVRGEMTGCWSYSCAGGFDVGGGDRSNGQFAVLGLFEAAHAGIAVKREVWERARTHWINGQGIDGGWSYGIGGMNGSSCGSMTVAGIASIVMTSAMLQDDKDVDANGNPDCCHKATPDLSLERGLKWLAKNFTIGSNPGSDNWHLYYLYGLERAGRLSGQRFFGEHDWYREGARFLLPAIDKRRNLWVGKDIEANPAIGTSFGLLFLSKGLAPVLINKLKFESTGTDPDAWNQHPNEVRNLTDKISGAPRWPKLVTWQTIDIKTVVKHGSVSDLRQAPVLYLSGADAPKFSEQEVALLREYVNVGGFILAVNTCGKAGFRDGLFELIHKMYPKGETSLERLKPEHPIFRAEHPLDGNVIELWGADLGCRTAIVYSPDDVGCLLNKWSRLEPAKRHRDLRTRVDRSMQIGINVVAYATGREPPNKLNVLEIAAQAGQADNVQRGLLQVAEVRHAGGWDTAPKSARNLLMAVNRSAGLTASTLPGAITLADPSLSSYSLLVMHGRHKFDIPDAEAGRLRDYLSKGRVLFADSCCGSAQFDRSFRKFVQEVYPDQPLKRIPPEHEIFTAQVGHELKKVRRRSFEVGDAKSTLEANIVEGEPFLEGIEIGGRYVVIYSKYDISCALERQASLACAGYVPDDAVKLAVNVVLYSLLQDVTGAKK